jgi:hypothetical protein
MDNELREFKDKQLRLYLNQLEMRDQMLEGQNNIAYTVDSVLDHIQTLMKKLDKLIELLSPVTSQNEKDNTVYDFEVRSIFVDDTESKKEIREAKRLEEEEKNIGLLLDSFTQNVYKKNLRTNEYIKVGYIDGDNILEFYSYTERTKPFVPDVYDSDWYVMKPIRSADGSVYPTYDRTVPNLSGRFLTQIGISKTYGVIGFTDKYGRDIYWDYFVQ